MLHQAFFIMTVLVMSITAQLNISDPTCSSDHQNFLNELKKQVKSQIKETRAKLDLIYIDAIKKFQMVLQSYEEAVFNNFGESCSLSNLLVHSSQFNLKPSFKDPKFALIFIENKESYDNLLNAATLEIESIIADTIKSGSSVIYITFYIIVGEIKDLLIEQKANFAAQINYCKLNKYSCEIERNDYRILELKKKVSSIDFKDYVYIVNDVINRLQSDVDKYILRHVNEPFLKQVLQDIDIEAML